MGRLEGAMQGRHAVSHDQYENIFYNWEKYFNDCIVLLISIHCPRAAARVQSRLDSLLAVRKRAQNQMSAIDAHVPIHRRSSKTYHHISKECLVSGIRPTAAGWNGRSQHRKKFRSTSDVDSRRVSRRLFRDRDQSVSQVSSATLITNIYHLFCALNQNSNSFALMTINTETSIQMFHRVVLHFMTS